MKSVGDISDFEVKFHVIGSTFSAGHRDCIKNKLTFGAKAQNYCGKINQIYHFQIYSGN